MKDKSRAIFLKSMIFEKLMQLLWKKKKEKLSHEIRIFSNIL